MMIQGFSGRRLKSTSHEDLEVLHQKQFHGLSSCIRHIVTLYPWTATEVVFCTLGFTEALVPPCRKPDGTLTEMCYFDVKHS